MEKMMLERKDKLDQLERTILELGAEIFRLKTELTEIKTSNSNFHLTLNGLKDILDDKGIIMSDDFEEYPDITTSIIPDFTSILKSRAATAVQPNLPGFDPHAMMVKKNQIEKGEIVPDPVPEVKWPEKDVKTSVTKVINLDSEKIQLNESELNEILNDIEEINVDKRDTINIDVKKTLAEPVSESDYSKMTIKQLKEILSVKGINPTKLKKNEMIELIEKSSNQIDKVEKIDKLDISIEKSFINIDE
jgi:regulator of replication initiation timing